MKELTKLHFAATADNSLLVLSIDTQITFAWQLGANLLVHALYIDNRYTYKVPYVKIKSVPSLPWYISDNSAGGIY